MSRSTHPSAPQHRRSGAHAIAHEPQWFSSIERSTHIPPQFASIGPHGTHAPARHTSGATHDRVHDPQCLSSRLVLTHSPAHIVIGATHASGIASAFGTSVTTTSRTSGRIGASIVVVSSLIASNPPLSIAPASASMQRESAHERPTSQPGPETDVTGTTTCAFCTVRGSIPMQPAAMT